MNKLGKLKEVTIYTDGACSFNPGPGAWAALLRYGHAEKEISGFIENTTNNQMELQAVIEALKILKTRCNVTVFTDSTYVQKGITEWIHNWQKKNFKDVKNSELWKNLLKESQKHNFKINHIYGHSGHIENERVNKIAQDLVKENMKENKLSKSESLHK